MYGDVDAFTRGNIELFRRGGQPGRATAHPADQKALALIADIEDRLSRFALAE